MILSLAASAAVALLLLLVLLPLYFVEAPPLGLTSALATTASLGGLAALLSLPMGLAAALATRRGGLWGAAMQALYVPAVVPPTSVGVLLLASFSLPRALCAGGAPAACPLSQIYDYFVNKPLGVLLAMFVMALPTSFSIYDGALKEERAEAYLRSLGFSGLSLLGALMSSLRRATISALVFSWIRSFGELGTLLIFASYPVTTSIYIYNAWLIYGVGPAVGASLAVMAAVLATAYAVRTWLSR